MILTVIEKNFKINTGKRFIYCLTQKIACITCNDIPVIYGETKDKIDGFKDVAEVANPDNLKSAKGNSNTDTDEGEADQQPENVPGLPELQTSALNDGSVDFNGGCKRRCSKTRIRTSSD